MLTCFSFMFSVMLGSYEADGPHLYMVEPSGVAWGYHACAIGKARQAAKTELEKLKVWCFIS
jgi:20S proteasome subunit alpha 7